MTPDRPHRRAVLIGGLAGAAALAVGAVVAARALRRAAPAPLVLPFAEEQAILAAEATELRVWRFAPQPSVLVIVFPSLHAQAAAMNRAAVFLELAGASRDQVPDDPAMRRLIAAANLQFDGFYYGHDYRVADLRRLWARAAAQNLTLGPEELALRDVVERAALAPEGAGAVITLPPPGEGLQDHRGRFAILRHELSHGLYFTDPTYAGMVDGFWRTRMSEAERATFRRFLAAQNYDTANDELVRNEMQAYLMHTPDARFFGAAQLGVEEPALADLRRRFLSAMPPGWLRARTTLPE